MSEKTFKEREKIKENKSSLWNKFFWYFIIGIIVVVMGGLILFFVTNWLSDKNIDNQQGRVASSFQNNNECKKLNLKDWETGQGQLIREDNLWSVASTSSNGLLRYKKSVSLYSEIRVTFVPHSEEQVNFVFHAHDLYEIVIGDGGYQGVTLKASSGSGQPMRIIKNTEGYKRNIFEKGELNPGADVTVVLDQSISRLEDDSYEVNIRALYRPGIEGEEDKLFATYDFPLPPKFNYEETNMRFSIGLLAANNGTNVSAEILCFEINKN